MKLYRCYTSKIDGNKSKMEKLENYLTELAAVSNFIHEEHPTTKPKYLYKICRLKFPHIPSKILQNFINHYKKNIKLNKPMKSGIYLDRQQFSVVVNDNKLTNYWLMFDGKLYPLFNNYFSNKIKNVDKIKTVHIFKRDKKFYCRFIVETEFEPQIEGTHKISYTKLTNVLNEIDDVPEQVILTRNQQKDISHKITRKIVNRLKELKVEVLLLDDYETTMYKLLDPVKKFIESIHYREFIDILLYKCHDIGISYNDKYESSLPRFYPQGGGCIDGASMGIRTCA